GSLMVAAASTSQPGIATMPILQGTPAPYAAITPEQLRAQLTPAPLTPSPPQAPEPNIYDLPPPGIAQQIAPAPVRSIPTPPPLPPPKLTRRGGGRQRMLLLFVLFLATTLLYSERLRVAAFEQANAAVASFLPPDPAIARAQRKEQDRQEKFQALFAEWR